MSENTILEEKACALFTAHSMARICGQELDIKTGRIRPGSGGYAPESLEESGRIYCSIRRSFGLPPLDRIPFSDRPDLPEDVDHDGPFQIS